MASRAANLTSIDAIRSFALALIQFEEAADDALVQLELESRRPVAWVDEQAMYWPAEVRKASDAVSEARLTLERCEITISGDDRKSCYDERKAFEKAKRRLHRAEAKVPIVRRWKIQIRKEVEEFEVQIAKLRQFLESDFVRGIAALQRMSEALDQYVQKASAGSGGGSSAATASGGDGEAAGGGSP